MASGGTFVFGEDEEDSEEEELEIEAREPEGERHEGDVSEEPETKTTSGEANSVEKTNENEQQNTQIQAGKDKFGEGKAKEMSAPKPPMAKVKPQERRRQTPVVSPQVKLDALVSQSEVLSRHKKAVKQSAKSLSQWRDATGKHVEQQFNVVDTNLQTIHSMLKGALRDMQAARDAMKLCTRLPEK